MSNVWDDIKIREAFIYDGGESEYRDPVNGAQTQRKVAGDLFDRWLAEHDAKVRAEALREAARYIKRITPKGLVDRAAVLADLEIAATRFESGIHANGRDRIESEAGLK